MGTLGAQPQRPACRIETGDLDSFLTEAMKLATKHRISVDSVIEARRVLEILLRELPVRQAADLAAQLTGTAPNVAYKLALRLSGKS